MPTLHAQVSEGNVLVADILRLSAALPPALAGGASPSAPVLFDFRYLKDPEAHERRVEADRQLAALDDCFREACSRMLPNRGAFAVASSATSSWKIFRALDLPQPSSNSVLQSFSTCSTTKCRRHGDRHSAAFVILLWRQQLGRRFPTFRQHG